MIKLDDAKLYLKVDHDDEDELIEHLIETSYQLCKDILRQASQSEVLKTAILFGVAYLYEHRETANHKELKETLYHLLLAERKDVF
ncbi:phage protein [Streptococcus varani]|uniref:Phage protein n=1 Tax=Streptococcus varani TaxID=1608583 RepID=A0A0E4H5D7_9STRE|nr:head-tail connector protein [Streptococcus varani]CQR24996.1 phage protein [Streptococcus varani]